MQKSLLSSIQRWKDGVPTETTVCDAMMYFKVCVEIE